MANDTKATPPDPDILARFRRNSPAEREVVGLVQAQAHVSLPADYVEFLLESDGGEGFIGLNYVVLHRVQDLIPINRGHLVVGVSPEFFVFGANGAGHAFAFDLRTGVRPVVVVPLASLETKAALPVALSFSTLLTVLSRKQLFGRS